MAGKYQKQLAVTGLSLRPHQIEGVRRTLAWRSAGHGGIVADEMGLGKTCQAIAVMNILSTPKRESRFLIICPLSVIDHWEMEIARFGLGKLHVKKYFGRKVERNARRKRQEEPRWNVLLTTYSGVTLDPRYFTQTLKFTALFFDEAHRIKRSSSVLHEIVGEIDTEFIVLLTGTPIQNNLEELYALLAVVDNEKFPLSGVEDFLAKYENMDDDRVAGDLRALLASYLLRRTKQEVAIEIPLSDQVVLYHGMTEMQKKMYRAILCKHSRILVNVNSETGRPIYGNFVSLLNVLMELRKCSSHPYLFYGVEPEPFIEGEHLVEASSKLALLDRLLKILKARGHRVLIFSQFTRVLDIVQDFLIYRGFSHERIDGQVKAEERYAAIRNFEKPNSSVFCFLLSTRAGGLGLTLVGADTAVFLDSDFNPQNDVQAAARCHRIGQTKPVKVIRLAAKNTVEEVILLRAARKLRLTHQVLGTGEYKEERLSAVELAHMILYGVGQVNETDAGQSVLTDDEIEKVIGTTENGFWKIQDSDDQEEQGIEKENAHPGVKDSEEDQEHDWHVFEGHDYRKNRELLKEMTAGGQTPETIQSPTVERRRPVKRKLQEQDSIFENVKISVHPLEEAHRSHYCNIIKAHNGIVVEDGITASESLTLQVDFVLVDASVSTEDLEKLKLLYQQECVFVKKEWIDQCVEADWVIDTEDFTV